MKTPSIFPQIKTLLQQARQSVVQSVNTTMVYTYFEIGRIIVEHEQGGELRAEYKKETLKNLSKNLKSEFGKGFSVKNLERMKLFYSTYGKSSTLSTISENQQLLPKNSVKPQAVSVVLQNNITKITPNNFTLSWSHYVLLMRLNEQERNFYEKEYTLYLPTKEELKAEIENI